MLYNVVNVVFLLDFPRYNWAVWLDYFRCILLNLKSLHRYDWIALLDVDEVIVPRKQHTSWAEMMEEVEEHLSSPHIITTYHIPLFYITICIII